MIVKDEERFLEDALRSVAGVVDEICIVDTGSTDRTREIALAAGARVLDVSWEDDFARARNAALAMARRRWIFVLDADERLAPGSREALVAIGRTRSSGRGKWISCRNLTDDCKGSGAMSNALVRIFPNDDRIRYRNAIHEFVTIDGGECGLPADRTAIEIVHHGYLAAIVAERAKAERNLRLSRRSAEREPSDPYHQYNLGMSSLLAGDRAGAVLALERMRVLTRTTPRGYRAHALVALAELYAEYWGDVQKAHAVIAECLSHVPNYSNAHFLHGRLLSRAGDLHAARDAFGRAIAAGAHDHEQFVVDDEIAIWKAHSEIGGTLMREGRYSEALAWFELASRARPGAQPLVINRAKCHEALGDTRSAAELFAAAYRRFADAPSTIEWINCLLRLGRSAEALEVIDAASAFVDAPTQALLLATAAAVHLRAGHTEAARAAVERALSCGDRAASAATVRTLAEHLAMPELAELLAPGSPRANRLQIAYAG
jgi:tetratricopeptide (TPR) repeat protein